MSRIRLPNVILITIDCLRFDHLGCYGYSRNTSPNIDNLASQGALFLEAISNGGRTPDSFPSILASQLPPIDSKEYEQIMQQSLTLAELLRDAGYQTVAFHDNPFLSRFYHYNNGFDIFEDNLGIEDGDNQQGIKHLLSGKVDILMKMKIRLKSIFNLLLFLLEKRNDITAEKLTNQAISQLNTSSNSFFLWLHYMDTHHPYLPPLEYVDKVCNRHISKFQLVSLYAKQLKSLKGSYADRIKQFSPAGIDTLVDLYDANIRYVDDNIGVLLNNLRDNFENTVIVITADHGDAFGEHDTLGHSSTLYDELLHVPLIIAGQGIKAGAVVNEPVELIDLAPTITALVGFSNVKNFHGRNLLPVIEGNLGIAEGIITTRLIPESQQRVISYRTTSWKYIRTESMGNSNVTLSEEIYDLKKDSRESYNLHYSQDNRITTFKQEALKNVKEFKLQKEKEEIKARFRKPSYKGGNLC